MLVFRLLIVCAVAVTAGKVAPDDVLLAPMRKYFTYNGRHILFSELVSIVQPQGWGLSRPRFNSLRDRLMASDGLGQSTLNFFLYLCLWLMELRLHLFVLALQINWLLVIFSKILRTRGDVRRAYNISRQRNVHSFHPCDERSPCRCNPPEW